MEQLWPHDERNACSGFFQSLGQSGCVVDEHLAFSYLDAQRGQAAEIGGVQRGCQLHTGIGAAQVGLGHQIQPRLGDHRVPITETGVCRRGLGQIGPGREARRSRGEWDAGGAQGEEHGHGQSSAGRVPGNGDALGEHAQERRSR